MSDCSRRSARVRWLAVVFAGMAALPVFAVAAQSTSPPAPPTVVPTPVGMPPPPPQLTSVATATAVAPAATATATAVVRPRARARFSLDAARVSLANNPGDLSGLVSVRPGTRVWLVMYFTVLSVPHRTQRLTTYTVTFGKRTVYKVSFKEAIGKNYVGRFSRFAVYTLPATLPRSRYDFHATLTIGDATQHRSWGFTIGAHNKVVRTKTG